MNFKKIILNRDFFISSLLALSFFTISILLPSYNEENGFFNLIFDDYVIVWRDGRSPANFHITKNIIEGKGIHFPRGYLIDNIKIENYFDFLEVDGVFRPVFNYLANYIYAYVLSIFPISNQLQLFKGMVLLTILFYTFSLFIFYFLQRELGLSLRYSALSTFVAGIATSILIYSRYLFIQYAVLTFLGILLIYVLSKDWKKMKKLFPRIEIVTSLLFSFFLIFLWYIPVILVFFLFLSIFFVRNRIIQLKILMIPSLFLLFFAFYVFSQYSNLPKPNLPNVRNIVGLGGNSVISIFPNYINALDFSIYGYHNQTDVWKPLRIYAYIYAFKEKPGNAIFLRSYGIFGILFGPKGIIFNSPFLIFSILGIFIYRDKEKRNLLSIFIILFIIIYGFLNPVWYGGVTPRYDRFLSIPILLLTFFSFYYIQKTKNIWAKLIFFTLVVLSILNVVSLAIRADWTYEHPADLVSYDIVLWPWYPSITTRGKTFYLTSRTEQMKWVGYGDGNCKPYFMLEGVITDPCRCLDNSWIVRSIKIPQEVQSIKIKACAMNAGNDGSQGEIFIDNSKIGKIYVQSNSCNETEFMIPGFADGKIHSIKLKSSIYGNCSEEGIIWKSIVLD